MPSRREQLDWMPRPKPLSAVFGAEEEELPVLPPEEELSLEDLEDEDEEEGEELTDILDEEGPAVVTETTEAKE
jgi:hypothetical protein